MVRRGYSRDHRPDCEQLVIALIVNNEGCPFSYETFDGNRSDVPTLETVLRMVVALGRRQSVSWSVTPLQVPCFQRGFIWQKAPGMARYQAPAAFCISS